MSISVDSYEFRKQTNKKRTASKGNGSPEVSPNGSLQTARPGNACSRRPWNVTSGGRTFGDFRPSLPYDGCLSRPCNA
jgi:hypothetical protein